MATVWPAVCLSVSGWAVPATWAGKFEKQETTTSVCSAATRLAVIQTGPVQFGFKQSLIYLVKIFLITIKYKVAYKWFTR